MLPRDELLQSSRHPQQLAGLIDLAEQALRTWEPVWSDFLAAAVLEEAQARLGDLAELDLESAGGWPQAERRRLCLRRRELKGDSAAAEAPLQGLAIAGNFLFDPAEARDMRQGLIAKGASPGAIGDIWIQGDRGAQLLVTPELAQALDQQAAQVRSVAVRLEALPLEQLQIPAQRLPRQLTTVEASLRLDAVASAGFGLSRNRMAELIRSGSVRINWQPVSSPSRELALGDRVRLEGRGELELLEVQLTKRDRWRLVLQRR
ncbi:MAG: photosystem II S4 domain protein [Cyanobacteria bacterium]|nr:photosystem II S4 domain protein [Cyanobacteriota bacterium]